MTVIVTEADQINAVQIIEARPIINTIVNAQPILTTVFQGAPGQSTEITPVSVIAAVPISGHRAVATNSNGQFIYADKDTPAHAQCTIGITQGAANAGDMATAIALGPIIEPTWNWTPQGLIFLGSNGVLTQTAPTTGFVLILGKAITPTQIFVHVYPAFIRS